MKFRYVLDVEAVVSIRKQILWFEEMLGDHIADFWMNSLECCLVEITGQPERNGFAPENGKWFSQVEIRQKRFRPWKGKPGWRVLYTIAGETVSILQIRYERQPRLDE